MDHQHAPRDPLPPFGAGDHPHANIDWEAAERSPEFHELIARRRRFVVPATAFFLLWYIGFIVLAGYAEDFMGESIYEGFTVGYALALSQFVMVWGLSWWYLRKSDDEFDPLREKAAARALRDLHLTPDMQLEEEPAPRPRVTREPGGAPAPGPSAGVTRSTTEGGTR